MEIGKTLSVTTRERWRAWLERNHDKAPEIWLLNPKKHTGKARLEYEHAVEEALCFGWIDSQERRVDDDHSALRFSPRKRMSNWSPSNIERMERLVDAGKVTPDALAAYREATSGRGTHSGKHPALRSAGRTQRRR